MTFVLLLWATIENSFIAGYLCCSIEIIITENKYLISNIVIAIIILVLISRTNTFLIFLPGPLMLSIVIIDNNTLLLLIKRQPLTELKHSSRMKVLIFTIIIRVTKKK